MKILERDKIDYVIYHDKCYDGFGSAYVIWNYFKNKYGEERANKITFYGASHVTNSNVKLPDVTGKNVIICDFSYKLNEIRQLIEKCNMFKIIDHHRHAKDFLEDLEPEYKIFDMNHSGICLTYHYMLNLDLTNFEIHDKKMPLLYRHIEDRDLYTHKIEFNDEFTIAFYNLEMKFSLFQKYENDAELEKLISKGKNYIPYQKNLLNNFVNTVTLIEHDGYSIAYTNNSMFKSDIGHLIFDTFPEADFSAIYHYDNSTDKTHYSLRSTDDRINVISIVEKFGGGGHRNASGVAFDNFVPILPINGNGNDNFADQNKMKIKHSSNFTTNDIICTLDQINSDHIEYENNLLSNNMRNVGINFIEIDGKCFVIAYCNSCGLKEKMANAMFEKYSLVDICAVYHYDIITNKTYYFLKSLPFILNKIVSFFPEDSYKILSDQVCTINFDSIKPQLPFTLIDRNGGIISTIKYSIDNFARKIVLDGYDIPYCVVNIKSDKTEIFKDSLIFKTIKAKMNQFMILLFRTNNLYNMFINEYFTCIEEEVNIGILAMIAEEKIEDTCLQFETDKDIHTILASIMMKNIFNAVETSNMSNINDNANTNGNIEI
jgi:hypothetical protein